jgi:hypothetical protein
MQAIPYPVARVRSGPDPGRFPGGMPPPYRSLRDWSVVIRIWADAFFRFDARVRAILARTPSSEEEASRAASEWCIACLNDVRAAIYELHVWVLYERVPLTHDGPAIVSYLSEAYVWCGDVLDDVERLLDRVGSGSAHRDSASSEDSDAYIEDFLGPLFGIVRGGGARTGPTDPTPHSLQPLAERLHVAIVSLNWALLTS